MTHQEKIEEMIKENHGMITTKEVVQAKIPTVYLTRMVEEGKLLRVNRGIYLEPTGDYDEFYFFQLQSKVVVFSYVSALYLHGFTDNLPDKMEVTIYRGYNAHRIKHEARIHYVSKDIYDLGIVPCKTEYGKIVYAYNMERTICDLIQHRKEIDSELFVKTIHRYCKDPNKDLAQLAAYAKKMNISQQVFEVMELSLGL